MNYIQSNSFVEPIMVQQNEAPPSYEHLERNDFVHRKHLKQEEEDIAICTCCYNVNDASSACGESCLNVLTSTECTPGYCPCGNYCKNQKFQKCEYAKTKLFKTNGRGWGLIADEDIKVGQFVIEYCGEVISCEEAKDRSQAYDAEDLKDAYIISLNALELIDATRKGSLARFINHSCQPNCQTRKWNVLGEIRVGIFAMQDIPAGTELSYNYNFEWYGGDKVRCLCGAVCCSGYLGAKSRGFQEATYLWEDEDSRYSVDDIPLYDSEDDEESGKYLKAIVPVINSDSGTESSTFGQYVPMDVKPLCSVPMEVDHTRYGSSEESHLLSGNEPRKAGRKTKKESRIRSNKVSGNYQVGSGAPSRVSPHHLNSKSKLHGWKQFDLRRFGDCLASEEARQEFSACKDAKDQAACHLSALYGEIRPSIEEHERDSQDAIPTAVAERWIASFCDKTKADFDFHVSVITNFVKGNVTGPSPELGPVGEVTPPSPCAAGEGDSLLLENGKTHGDYENI